MTSPKVGGCDHCTDLEFPFRPPMLVLLSPVYTIQPAVKPVVKPVVQPG